MPLCLETELVNQSHRQLLDYLRVTSVCAPAAPTTCCTFFRFPDESNRFLSSKGIHLDGDIIAVNWPAYQATRLTRLTPSQGLVPRC